MTELWNETDIGILREQFPTIFMVEDWFTEAEWKEMNEQDE